MKHIIATKHTPEGLAVLARWDAEAKARREHADMHRTRRFGGIALVAALMGLALSLLVVLGIGGCQ